MYPEAMDEFTADILTAADEATLRDGEELTVGSPEAAEAEQDGKPGASAGGSSTPRTSRISS